MREIDFDERRNEVDEDCEIVHSELCDWMAAKTGCPSCYIKTLKSDDLRREALEKWKLTLDLIPNGIDSLFETDDCQFCKDEARKADGYAFVEVAHPEPYFEKGMFFGIGKKVRTPVGSLLGMQASVCPRCRKTFILSDVLQVIFLVGFIAASIILLLIPQISEPMSNVFEFLPLIFVLLLGIAGYAVGRNVQIWYMRKMAKKVKLDLAEIPFVKRMLDGGWFFFQMNNGIPKVSFSKSKQYDRLKGGGADGGSGDIMDDIPLDNINI